MTETAPTRELIGQIWLECHLRRLAASPLSPAPGGVRNPPEPNRYAARADLLHGLEEEQTADLLQRGSA